METYKQAMKEYSEWFATLPMEEEYVVSRHLAREISHQGLLETFIHEDKALRYSEAQTDEILSRLKKVELLSSWQQQAERQVFVQEAVKVLQAAVEKTQALRDVAVTVCPQSGTLESCQAIMALLLTLTCFKGGGIYVFEQRSEQAPAHGWHIHVNLKSKYPPSKVQQYITQKLSAAKSLISFSQCKSADAKWLTHYMLGMGKGKGDSSKLGKSAYDKVLRKELGLQDSYAF